MGPLQEIKDKVQVIYTTHSPYLLDLNTLYRVLAVQRADLEDEKSETLVFDIHALGAASTDTLSPIYTLMGVDFSHQQVIQKTNNVILEEISAFYYLTAFWKLLGRSTQPNFLAATGSANVPQLTYLFLGWGLEFIVVLDDDGSGRQTYNRLKRDLFGDDEQKAMRRLHKIKNCNGIEDLFSMTDFKKIVLRDETAKITMTNSEYMKANKKPKAVAALSFLLRVKNEEVKLDNLQKKTKEDLEMLVNSIESMLNSFLNNS